MKNDNDTEKKEFDKKVEDSKIRAQNLAKRVEDSARYFNEIFADIEPYHESENNETKSK